MALKRARGLIILLFSISCLFRPAIAVDKKTAADIDREIEKIRSEIIKIRRFIHLNPQLANHEQETAKFVGAKLASLGIDVKSGVAKTGLVALLAGSQPGPTVAVRAAMDAVPIQELADVPFKSIIPGVMHAAGHDIHTAIVLGTAYVLSTMRDRIKGNVKFIFQPAEEGPPPGEEGGAALMIKEGVLENPAVQAIFGFHVWPEDVGQVFISPGAMLANSDSFEIVIKGKNSQGSQPQEGVDAIVLASEIVMSLQTIISRFVDPTDPALLNIGKIEGGTRDDLVPDRVRLEGIIRTLSDTNRKKIARLIESMVKGIIHAAGGDYSFSFEEDIPSVYNHPELVSLLLPTLNEALGENKAIPINPQMMADDFALYSQKIPGFYFFLGAKNPRLPSSAPLYSPYFNPDERSISLGIKILCYLILDSLEQQSRIAKASF
jgi:amidohydrolase